MDPSFAKFLCAQAGAQRSAGSLLATCHGPGRSVTCPKLPTRIRAFIRGLMSCRTPRNVQTWPNKLRTPLDVQIEFISSGPLVRTGTATDNIPNVRSEVTAPPSTPAGRAGSGWPARAAAGGGRLGSGPAERSGCRPHPACMRSPRGGVLACATEICRDKSEGGGGRGGRGRGRGERGGRGRKRTKRRTGRTGRTRMPRRRRGEEDEKEDEKKGGERSKDRPAAGVHHPGVGQQAAAGRGDHRHLPAATLSQSAGASRGCFNRNGGKCQQVGDGGDGRGAGGGDGGGDGGQAAAAAAGHG